MDEDLFKKKGYSPIYGELTEKGAITILRYLKKKRNLKTLNFADLGSGNGKPCFFFAPYVKNAYGVELSKERYDISLKHNTFKNVTFYNEDMFDMSYENIDLVYISNLCFSSEINEKLAHMLYSDLPDKAIILSSHPLNIPGRSHILYVWMTWSERSPIHVKFVTKKRHTI
jgi:SAM-dependent methyltransferase